MGQEGRSQFAHIVPGKTRLRLLTDGQMYTIQTFDGENMSIANSEASNDAPLVVQASKGGFIIEKDCG